MEVADSHMSEHFSTHAPSHTDIDMAGEYYDEEYIMHDATEPTNDTEIEIYDAEIDEQPIHDEVEMDEYTDDIPDDETHMGTYVPADDATVTDVTVEDVQLRSSPIASGTPRGVPMHPISPHATIDADLALNEAPADALVAHSPHSVATLVDDSEVHPAQAEGTKEDPLNEVIDLTGAEDLPQDPSVEVAEPTEHDAVYHEVEATEHEVYESEAPAVEPGSPPAHPLNPNQQPEGVEGVIVLTDIGDGADAPSYLEIPDQAEQDSHSPIEEALVINQQVRDDAADSMEPSPPVRLYYKEENLGIDETFDIFAPSGLDSEDAKLLFQDNRTLYYEPLSSFFVRLRETEYFSGSNWQDAEMKLRLELGTSDLTIGEDHRDTDNVSLFKLAFIWSGLGLDGPPCLTIKRHPERFATRFARLVEQVEQGDLHHDETEALHEVREGAESETNDDERPGVNGKDTTQKVVEENPGNNGDENNGGGEDQEAGDPHVAEDDDRAHAHESEDVGDEGEDEDAAENVTSTAEPPEEVDARRHETGVALDNPQNVEASDPGPDSEHDAVNQDAVPTQENEQNTHSLGAQDVFADDVDNANIRDQDGGLSSHESSPNSPKADSEVPQDEYEEYETVDNDQQIGPNGLSAPPAAHAEPGNYDEYEDYEDAEDDQATEDQSPTDQPADSDETNVAPPSTQAEVQGSASNSSLKRHIDEVECERYDTPSAPSSPASEHKRLKHT